MSKLKVQNAGSFLYFYFLWLTAAVYQLILKYACKEPDYPTCDLLIK